MKIKTKKIMKRKIALLLLSIFMFSAASAQCTFKNTAFKGGEFLSYNLMGESRYRLDVHRAE